MLRYVNTSDRKVLIENFLSLTFLKVLGMVLPLITLPYLIRVLGFERYGIIVLANSLMVYFQSVTDFSFMITATRDVAVFRSSPKKLNLIFSNVLLVKCLFLAISLLFILFIVLLYEPFYNNKEIFLLSTLSLLGHALLPDWFFQGVERMKVITIISTIIRVIFTVSVFIFIANENDYWLLPLLQGLGSVGAGAAAQYIMLNKYNIKFYWLKPQRLKNTIKSNFPIFVNQFFPTLYNNTSTFLLGLLTNTYFVGVYDALKKITDILVSLMGILSRVFFPFLSRKSSAFIKYKNLMLIACIGLVVLIMAGYKLIISFLNVDYIHAFWVLSILLVSTIGYALYNIFGLNYFIVRREDRLVMKNTISSSIIGFITAFPLIYFYGILGAAFNLALARMLMGGQLYYKWYKIQRYEK